MTTTAILETTKSWASQCFRPEAGQLEVSEKPAPPPFVDLPSDSADRTGVFLGLKHVDGGELQILNMAVDSSGHPSLQATRPMPMSTPATGCSVSWQRALKRTRQLL